MSLPSEETRAQGETNIGRTWAGVGGTSCDAVPVCPQDGVHQVLQQPAGSNCGNTAENDGTQPCDLKGAVAPLL